jgi:outer membrane protein insertion porin family
MAESDAAAIAEAYRVSRGRLAATITPKIIRRSENRVDLVFEITEGKVVEKSSGCPSSATRRSRIVVCVRCLKPSRRVPADLIQRDTYVPERLELDKAVLTEFYLSRGYIDFQVLDASADFSRERDATFVTFTVREGLPLRHRQGDGGFRSRRDRCR